MISRIPSLDALAHELAKLPGIGPKTAQRLAYFILKSSADYAQDLSTALKNVKERVHECTQCFSYTENQDLCPICLDPQRREDLLCVVEDPSDIMRIESSGAFRGRYHVLHGTISPLEGVGPKDLKIAPLLERIRLSRAQPGGGIREVLMALDADLEGDTTVLYLANLLRELNVETSRIAHGVPIGGDIDYIDFRTLGRAIENRVQL